jgi:transglutaminase-like putative cysteine protease
MFSRQRKTVLLQEVRRLFHIRRWVKYQYSQPVHDVKTTICTTPHQRRGTLQLLDQKLHIAPPPDSYRIQQDNFGNQFIRVEHKSVSNGFLITSEYVVQNAAKYTISGQIIPAKIRSEFDNLPSTREIFLNTTPLTLPGKMMHEIVQEAICKHKQRDSASTESLVFELVQRLNAEMCYIPNKTNICTTAEEAWMQKYGVCQDYAHLALAFCRLAGIPARYVSGFIAHPKATAMHAWIEAFVSWETQPDNTNNSTSGFWVALDPTHGCYINERYITVAIGRDYSDVKPVSGAFWGSAKASVTSCCEIRELATWGQN